MPSLAAGAAAAAHLRRTQAIHGVSAGGVVLPPGVGSQGESVAPNGTQFAHQLFPHEIPERMLENRKKEPAGVATPARLLSSESLAMMSKPPNSLVFWLPTPIMQPSLLFEVPDKPTQTFTFPLVAEMMGLIGHSRANGTGFQELLRELGKGPLPTVKIGWSAIAPTVTEPAFTWWGEEEERFRRQNIAFPAGEPLHPLAGSFAGTDVWALTGAAPYTIPIEWTYAPRPLDALVVGKALDGRAYKPRRRPGGVGLGTADWLYPPFYAGEGSSFPQARREREAGEAYAAMGSGAKAAQWAAWAAGDVAIQAAWKTNKVEFDLLSKIYKHWEEMWAELVAIPWYLDRSGPPETEKEGEEQLALENAINSSNVQSKEHAYEEMSNAEKPLRQASGPFMNGVEDYLYRMDLKRPPGGLPDMTGKVGYLIIEFSGPEGARWLGRQAYEGGMSFDWPFTDTNWLGKGPEGVLDNFEVSRGGHGTPGTTTAGPHAVAKLAS